jgi:nucleoside-diphosphate-sugar epimerase
MNGLFMTVLKSGLTSLAFAKGKSPFRSSHGDIRDERLMRSLVAKADVIVALAALVSPKVCAERIAETTDVNTNSIAMLNQLRSKSQPIFFPNTNIGYGTKVRSDIYTEDSPLDPASHYGVTKVAAERLIQEAGEYVIFRLASVFGPSPAMKKHLLLNFYVNRAYVLDAYARLYQLSPRRRFPDPISLFEYGRIRCAPGRLGAHRCHYGFRPRARGPEQFWFR